MPDKKPIEILPIDPKQCQSLKPNGNTLMTFGGRPGHVRCVEKPTWVGMRLDKDTKLALGMSLCDLCKGVMERQLPTGVSYQRLAREKS